MLREGTKVYHGTQRDVTHDMVLSRPNFFGDCITNACLHNAFVSPRLANYRFGSKIVCRFQDFCHRKPFHKTHPSGGHVLQFVVTRPLMQPDNALSCVVPEFYWPWITPRRYAALKPFWGHRMMHRRFGGCRLPFHRPGVVAPSANEAGRRADTTVWIRERQSPVPKPVRSRIGSWWRDRRNGEYLSVAGQWPVDRAPTDHQCSGSGGTGT